MLSKAQHEYTKIQTETLLDDAIAMIFIDLTGPDHCPSGPRGLKAIVSPL